MRAMNGAHRHPLTARQSALDILAGEHRAFDAALAGLVEQVALVRAGKAPPDGGLFDRSLGYLATFMDRFHHPKEDEHLFRAVRSRTSEADAVLAHLHHDHAKSARDYARLRRYAALVAVGAMDAFEEMAERFEAYARQQLEHMRLEGEVMVPLAERVLRPSDWLAIDLAFRANRDPFFGAAGGARSVIVAPTRG